MFFTILLVIVIAQRLFELFMARRNEKWMRSQGAFEIGASHYPLMVAMHCTFFIALILEVGLLNRAISVFWIPLLILFLLAQVARVWCLLSLGRFWNTKIIILPNTEVIRTGPYRFMRHPNYFIVTLELIVLPLMFSAYFTAILYFILNAAMLSVRIPLEEKALKDSTNYSEKFSIE